MDTTQEEEKSIKAMKRLAAKWPKSLWLFSASGNLHVMKKGDEGKRVMLETDGVDPDYSVATIPIENDGGDW